MNPPSFIQSSNTDPVLEYYSLDDFALFDHEEAFWELCDSLNFEPSASEQSGDDASTAAAAVAASTGNKRKRSMTEDNDARLPSSVMAKTSSSPPKDMPASQVPIPVSPAPSLVNTIPPVSHVSSDYVTGEIDHAKVSYARTTEDPKTALKSIHEVNAFVAIPASDIRRQFAIMFAEAIGSNDGEQLAKILQTHCTDDAVLIFKYKGKNSPYGPTFLEVIGKHAIVVFWPQGIATVPDMVFELLSTNIKVLSNGYCSITTKCKLTGTKVLELAVDSKDNVVLVSDPTQQQNGSGKASSGDGVLAIAIESESNPQVLPNQVPDDTLLKKVHRTGVKMNLITTITYYVDPNKQIYRIEFIHAMQHEKPAHKSK